MNEQIQRTTKLTRLYWVLPLLLSLLQLTVTIASTRRVLYEELAESVRNVFWLQSGLIYDGKSSNIGWYATLLLVYKIFGYSLFTAKFVRLAFHVIALYCAAFILQRAIGWRRSIVPLIVIGVSPILLYYDTMQISSGIDLSYAAISLLLLLTVRIQSATTAELAKTFLWGAVTMWGAMTYPTFLLCLPSLVVVWIWRFNEARENVSLKDAAFYLLGGTIGLLVPLTVTLASLRTPGLLIYDAHTNAGLFRSGGGTGFDPAVLKSSLGIVLHDLFVRGESYYFELAGPDFSGPLGIVGFVFVVATAVYLVWREPRHRLLLGATFLLLFLSLVVANFSTAGHPGMRRCTGAVAAFFVLFAFAWSFWTGANFRNVWLRRLGILLCLAVPINNIRLAPALIASVREKSDYSYPWFETKDTPPASLQEAISATADGQPLACLDEQGNPFSCRYQEIYAAIAGYRLWNGLGKIDVKALDPNTGRDIVLEPTLWQEYYFSH